MPSARERFLSTTRASRKKRTLGGLRIILVIVVISVLALTYHAPRTNLRELMTGAFSKRNQGIILNYFPMSSERTVEVLGEPDAKNPFRENEQLFYWKFDPVTLEIHFHRNQVSRVAYATSVKTIRDDLVDRALKVYGNEVNWNQRRRTIDGEQKIVFENEASHMTVVKYDKSVMVYNYLFPEAHATASE